MKKIIIMIIACLLVFASALLVGCGQAKETPIRIHIRAHSNSASDQAVKLAVRDEIVAHLSPKLENAASKSDAYRIIENSLAGLTKTADRVLAAKGFSYTSDALLTNEYFPARSYGDVVLDSGNYDALIINLGSGDGDNWWCVAYPPMCFYGNDSVEYSSLILEWFKKK